MKMSKYPRTFHAPYSEGATNDDRIHQNMDVFKNMDLVYLSKLDGENTIASNTTIHARSEDGYGKLWQTPMIALWSCFKYNIPEGMTICGENVYAIHSIEYTKLPTIFFVFNIIMDGKYLGWNEVCQWSELLGLDTVPEIARGKYIENMSIPQQCFFGPTCEGYVARNVNSFAVDDFSNNTFKVVRKDHVKTDKHWTKNWKKANIVEDPVERLLRKSKMY